MNNIKSPRQGIIFRGLSIMSLLFIILIVSWITVAPGVAETFPNRPVQLIVPFGPGSGTDLVARGIQPYVKAALGVPLMIENVPGADSRIGMMKIYKAQPDGYTIGIHGFPAPLITEALFEVSYKSAQSSFIYAWTMNPQLIFVAEGTWNTFDEFVVEARKRPMTMGLSGLGTVSHLMALMLEKYMKLKFNYIPYSSSSGSLTTLAGRHIDATFGSTDAALGMVQAKKVRPLLTFAFHGDPNFPEVPLSTKYNIPTIVMTRGVFGPPKMPEDRIRILEKGFAKAAAEPKLAEWVKSRGMDLVALNAKQYRQAVEKQQALLREYKDLLKTP